MGFEWFKLHSRGWLTGSIRVQLTPEERSVWVDLLAMASESRVRGVICRAEGIPYEREYIAQYLGIPIDLLNNTIEICAKDMNPNDLNIARLIVEPDGCIKLNNWGFYQTIPESKGKPSFQEDARERELRERRTIRTLTEKYSDEAVDKLQEKGYEVKEPEDRT